MAAQVKVVFYYSTLYDDANSDKWNIILKRSVVASYSIRSTLYNDTFVVQQKLFNSKTIIKSIIIISGRL